MNNISIIDFNGEYLDATLDNYHLGNGYRAYYPAIMAFTAPDDMSPFGMGGINPYVYCHGDPINNTDSTGHFLGFSSVVGGILQVIGLPDFTHLTALNILEAAAGDVVNVGSEILIPGVGPELAVATENVIEATFRSVSENAVMKSLPDYATVIEKDALTNSTRNVKTFIRPSTYEEFQIEELSRIKDGSKPPPSYASSHYSPTPLNVVKRANEADSDAIVRSVGELYQQGATEQSPVSKVTVTNDVGRLVKVFRVHGNHVLLTDEQVMHLDNANRIVERLASAKTDYTHYLISRKKRDILATINNFFESAFRPRLR